MGWVSGSRMALPRTSSLHGTPQKSLFYILLVAGGAHGAGHGAGASAVERLLVRPKG